MKLTRRALLVTLPAFSASPGRADGAENYFTQAEHRTGGRIGLYARNLSTGAKLTWRANERFVMCSTFKMSLAACVLSRVDKGQETLSRFIPYSKAQLLDYAPVAEQNLAKGGMTVETMCQGAVELSDNTCANLLLASIGGPDSLTRFWREQGDAITRLDHTEPKLNFPPPGSPEDSTTPAAMAADVQRFLLGDTLSQKSRALLTGWMLNCQTGKLLLRAGLPAGYKLAEKTGNNGADAIGDIGIAWTPSGAPIVICAYTKGGHPAPEILPPIIAGLGQKVAQQLG